MFEKKTAVIDVIDYKALLPCDFYSIIGVKCNCENAIGHLVSTDVYDVKANFKGHPTYKIQGRVLVSSIEDAELEVAYTAIKQDENGWPMVVDDEAFKRTLVLYITQKQMFNNTLSNPSNATMGAYNLAKAAYVEAANVMRSHLSKPNAEEFENIARMINSPIMLFNGHDEGFRNIGMGIDYKVR